MTNEEIKQIVEQFGWKDLGKQKSSHLLSFMYKNFRMNFYITTGTVTIQDTTIKYDSGRVYKGITTTEKLRSIFP